jgi:hypothetical protein
MTAAHGSAPPPPELGGLADPVGGAAAAGTETEPCIGTSEVLVVVAIPIDAVRVSDAPAAGVNVAVIVQLPLLAASVLPGLHVADAMRKSVASPPVAMVTALFVANVSGAVPVLRIVTVAFDEAPTAVAVNIAPPVGA